MHFLCVFSLLLIGLNFLQVFADSDAGAAADSQPVLITAGAYRKAVPGEDSAVQKKVKFGRNILLEKDPLMSSGSNAWPQYKEITKEDREQRENDKFLKHVPKVS